MSDKSQFALVAKSASDIESMLIEFGDDMTPELQNVLKSIAQNVDLSASLMERFEASAAVFKKKAQAYQEIARGFEKSESYLRQMIKDDMIAHDVKELSGSDVKFKLVATKPKLVIDEANLDSAYIMHVPAPDKKKIEEALSLGIEVKGAHQEASNALRSYIIKKVEK